MSDLHRSITGPLGRPFSGHLGYAEHESRGGTDEPLPMPDPSQPVPVPTPGAHRRLDPGPKLPETPGAHRVLQETPFRAVRVLDTPAAPAPDALALPVDPPAPASVSETRSWRRAASALPEEKGLSLPEDHVCVIAGGAIVDLKGRQMTPEQAKKADYLEVRGVWFSPTERRAGLLGKPPAPANVRDVRVAGRPCKLEVISPAEKDPVRAAAKPRLYTAEQYFVARQGAASQEIVRQSTTARFVRRLPQ